MDMLHIFLQTVKFPTYYLFYFSFHFYHSSQVGHSQMAILKFLIEKNPESSIMLFNDVYTYMYFIIIFAFTSGSPEYNFCYISLMYYVSSNCH